MSRRRRGLSEEERALWDRVAGTAKPMRTRRPLSALHEPAPKVKPPVARPAAAEFHIGDLA